MSVDIEELKRKALACQAFHDAGCPVDDAFDTYPPDHYDAAVQPKYILALIDRLESAERDGDDRWQQGWNECSALRETQIAEAERDAAKYRALLASAKGKPESMERLLPEGSHDHYISQSVIDAFEADPNVQMAAHILVSERPGKFDLIHLVAYLMSSHWMPIDDAPKGQSLLLWTDHGPALGWWSVFDNQWTAGLWTALFPTHYMLIPPMPETKP